MLSKLVHTNPHAAPTILRLALGAVFFAHGAQKMLGWWGGRGFSATMSGFEHTGIPAVFAFLVVAAEFFGGIGLIVGLLGRVAAFGIACVMVVAIAKVHAVNGFLADRGRRPRGGVRHRLRDGGGDRQGTRREWLLHELGRPAEGRRLRVPRTGAGDDGGYHDRGISGLESGPDAEQVRSSGAAVRGDAMIRGLAVAVGFLVVGCHARAEKRITVKITHAPSLTGALAGKLVMPGQLTGDCAKEFGDLVFQDMRVHGVAMAGGADSAAAAAPAIVLSIDVSRCEARPQPAILGEGLPAVHISRTEGWFLAQVRAVDRASGQEVAAVVVRDHAQKENQSQTGIPEWPAPSELKSMAVRQGLAEAQRLYATWIESREIPFMDSKECHLKRAFDVAKAGDYEALVKLSRANAESCGTGSRRHSLLSMNG